jgi:hypothetical protein
MVYPAKARKFFSDEVRWGTTTRRSFEVQNDWCPERIN